MSRWDNWSDLTKWVMGIVSALIIAGLVALTGFIFQSISGGEELITPSELVVLDCPGEFQRVPGRSNVCTLESQVCDVGLNTSVTCGVSQSWTGGTATAILVPPPWRIESVDYSSIHPGFANDLPENAILCEAHGNTPICGDTGRHGNVSNVVSWHAVISADL